MTAFATSYPTAVDSDDTLGTAVNNLTTNAANTTLSAGIDASVTTIPVVTTTNLAAQGAVSIATGTAVEIVTYTGKTSNTLTGCTRGADGSTAAAHLSGDGVYGSIVAAYQAVLKAAIVAVETKVGTGASVPTTTGHVLTVTGAGATAFQAPAAGSPASWSGVTFQNSFADSGSPDATVAYRLEADGLTVRLRGLMSTPGGGGTDQTAFTLPSGKRPVGRELSCCLASGGTARVDIQTDGQVIYRGSGNAWVSLADITFSTV